MKQAAKAVEAVVSAAWTRAEAIAAVKVHFTVADIGVHIGCEAYRPVFLVERWVKQRMQENAWLHWGRCGRCYQCYIYTTAVMYVRMISGGANIAHLPFQYHMVLTELSPRVAWRVGAPRYSTSLQRHRLKKTLNYLRRRLAYREGELAFFWHREPHREDASRERLHVHLFIACSDPLPTWQGMPKGGGVRFEQWRDSRRTPDMARVLCRHGWGATYCMAFAGSLAEYFAKEVTGAHHGERTVEELDRILLNDDGLTEGRVRLYGYSKHFDAVSQAQLEREAGNASGFVVQYPVFDALDKDGVEDLIHSGTPVELLSSLFPEEMDGEERQIRWRNKQSVAVSQDKVALEQLRQERPRDVDDAVATYDALNAARVAVAERKQQVAEVLCEVPVPERYVNEQGQVQTVAELFEDDPLLQELVEAKDLLRGEWKRKTADMPVVRRLVRFEDLRSWYREQGGEASVGLPPPGERSSDIADAWRQVAADPDLWLWDGGRGPATSSQHLGASGVDA